MSLNALRILLELFWCSPLVGKRGRVYVLVFGLFCPLLYTTSKPCSGNETSLNVSIKFKKLRLCCSFRTAQYTMLTSQGVSVRPPSKSLVRPGQEVAGLGCWDSLSTGFHAVVPIFTPGSSWKSTPKTREPCTMFNLTSSQQTYRFPQIRVTSHERQTVGAPSGITAAAHHFFFFGTHDLGRDTQNPTMHAGTTHLDP